MTKQGCVCLLAGGERTDWPLTVRARAFRFPERSRCPRRLQRSAAATWDNNHCQFSRRGLGTALSVANCGPVFRFDQATAFPDRRLPGHRTLPCLSRITGRLEEPRSPPIRASDRSKESPARREDYENDNDNDDVNVRRLYF